MTLRRGCGGALAYRYDRGQAEPSPTADELADLDRIVPGPATPA